ncbi:unnamed protein product [Closterium sp. Naga37s-1]|nr:unnamed protein product [Closterium sp. Naga37s-1]
MPPATAVTQAPAAPPTQAGEANVGVTGAVQDGEGIAIPNTAGQTPFSPGASVIPVKARTGMFQGCGIRGVVSGICSGVWYQGCGIRDVVSGMCSGVWYQLCVQGCGIRSPHPRPAGPELHFPTYRLPPPSLPLIALPSSSPVSLAGHLTRALQDRSFILRRTGSLASMRRCVEPVVEADVAPDVADAGSSSAGGGYDVEQPPSGVAQEPELAKTFEENVKEEKEVHGQGSQGQQVREQARAEEAREPARRGSKLQVWYDDDGDDDVAEDIQEHFTWIGEEEEGDDLDVVYEQEEEREEEERKEKEWRRRAGRKEGGEEGGKEGEGEGQGGGGEGGGGEGEGGEGKKQLVRQATMARREASTELTVWQSLVLTVQCFFQQLFNPITQSDYYTLRLAFIHVTPLAHFPPIFYIFQNQDLPRDFDFYHYVVGSLEKDFVYIVGLR